MENRIKAQVFLYILAYYVEEYMRKKPAPILSDDRDTAPRSEMGLANAQKRRTANGRLALSFQDLHKDLATLSKIRVHVGDSDQTFDDATISTPLQEKAFRLLNFPHGL